MKLTEEQIRKNIKDTMMRDGKDIERWHKVAIMNGYDIKVKKPERKLNIRQCPLLVNDKVWLS